MKTIYNIPAFLLIAFFATSCKTPKPFAARFKQEQRLGKDTSTNIFLVKKDGEKITGKKLRYSNSFRLLKRIDPVEQWVAVDGRKISFGDYDTIQTPNAFKILYTIQPDTAQSAADEDDEEATVFYINRLRAGKISLYHYETDDTTAAAYKRKNVFHEYIFQKYNGKSEVLEYAAFADAISDNHAAVEKLKQLFPSGSIPKKKVLQTLKNLTTIADLYNNTTTGSTQVSR